MSGGPLPEWSIADQARMLMPVIALAIAIIAAVTDPSSGVELLCAALVVVAYAVWAFLPNVPLWALSLAVLIPVVVSQRSGQLEPLLFEVSLLAFIIGLRLRSLPAAVALGLLAAFAPVAASLLQDPGEVAVGIWIMGIAFPWVLGRLAARQQHLVAQLEATRRELDRQALLAERRQVARDVHDSVGHGLAAVLVQVTSARYVLRRDPAAAEEALRSAEEVGRRSMQELRRTVALLRRDEESSAASPVPSARQIDGLVEQARAGGLDAALRTQGELARVPPELGVALYRIAQEALSNATRHAPHAQTVLTIEVAERWTSLVAETSGPIAAGAATEPARPRYGLIGMRERVNALAGEFSAGPLPGGWRVTCRLPMPAQDPASAVGAQRS